jgi:uncharacterized protein YbcI
MKYRINTEKGEKVVRSREAVAEWVELNFQEYKRIWIEKITGDGFVKEVSDLSTVCGRDSMI